LRSSSSRFSVSTLRRRWRASVPREAAVDSTVVEVDDVVAGGGGWGEEEEVLMVVAALVVSGEDGGDCSLPNPFPDFLAICSCPLSMVGWCVVVHAARTRGVVKAWEEVVIAQRSMI